ncbi:MAG: CvpA family protein [Eubacterium sp.]|nr:CvpA family protein [Eubacterium sp.]
MIIFNYVVNYIDIALIAILLIFMIIGFCRGLLINVVNFLRWSCGLFLCFFLSQNLSSVVYENYVKPSAVETINKNIVTSTNIDEIMKSLQSFAEKLPNVLTKSVDFSKLSIKGDDLASEILDNYFEGIFMLLTKAAIFIAVFIIFFLITGIIILIVRKSSKRKEERRGKKSALKKTDRFLGGILGLLKGALVVFAITSVLMIIVGLYDDESQMSDFIKQVNNSQLITFVDSINPFNAITKGIL